MALLLLHLLPAMKPSYPGYRCSLVLAAILCWMTLFSPVAAGAAPVRFPPVPEAPDLGWVRQLFSESLPRLNLDPLLFPPAGREMPPRPAGQADTAWMLLAQANTKAAQAESRGNDGRLHEEAARLYMQSYAADKRGSIGFLALRLAARSYFLGGHDAEAVGVATTLVKRSGGGGAELPFYLLKGEALYQKRDLLAARECFRRALAGKFNAVTKTRIALRIADASLELGNVAYAEPAYRKALSGPVSRRKLPFNAIRHGEALIASEKYEDAAAIFRNLDTEAEEVPPLARTMAMLGAGDVEILSGDLVAAQTAYMRAATFGDFPETRNLLKLRMADLAFAGGNRAGALTGYGLLAESSSPAIAREAGYKKALSMYLLGDFPGAVRISEGWISRFSGKSGEKGMRTLMAKSGVEIVRAAGKANPADRWSALSALLFTYGRTNEWAILLGDIGTEWESARIWGGAADLYAAAGDSRRSADMRRIGRAESAYYRGDLPAVFDELGWKGPGKENASGALWLAAKTFFRQGRHPEVDAALRRLEKVQADSQGVREKSPFPPEKELAAFNRAEMGHWPELRDALREISPLPRVPGLAMIKALAEPKKPAAPETGAKPKKGVKKALAGSDIYADYLQIRARIDRINDEGALQ